MHSREVFDLYFRFRNEGMSVRDASRRIGAPLGTCQAWEAGHVPRSYGWAGRGPASIRDGRRAATARAKVPEVPLNETGLATPS